MATKRWQIKSSKPKLNCNWGANQPLLPVPVMQCAKVHAIMNPNQPIVKNPQSPLSVCNSQDLKDSWECQEQQTNGTHVQQGQAQSPRFWLSKSKRDLQLSVQRKPQRLQNDPRTILLLASINWKVTVIEKQENA